MKHLQTRTPIRTNRNKFNSSSPFRIVFSGTFNRNIYYDLSSAYLKIKIRCKPNQLKTVTKHEGSVTAVTTPFTNLYLLSNDSFMQKQSLS